MQTGLRPDPGVEASGAAGRCGGEDEAGRRSAVTRRWRRRAPQGFTRVEALVAMLMLSIGLFAVAVLQSDSVAATSVGSGIDGPRSQASLLATELVEQMRANREAALAGAYDVALGVVPSPSASRAGADLLRWKQQLAAALPDGDGAVSRNGTHAGIVTVTVEWREPGAPAASLRRFRTTVRLQDS